MSTSSNYGDIEVNYDEDGEISESSYTDDFPQETAPPPGMLQALQRAAKASERDNVSASYFSSPRTSAHRQPHLYRRYSLQQAVERAFVKRSDSLDTVNAQMQANEVVIEKLEQAGVHVFIVSHLNTGGSKHKLWKEIKRMIYLASDLSSACGCEPERCLLYQDNKGRLFNVVVRGEFSGLAGSWESDMSTFSGLESMAALVILVRAFGCSSNENLTAIRPGSLAFILGLILTEETSLVWLTTAMLIWGCPSVSAFGLTQVVTTDWPRQALLLILVFAGLSEDGSENQRLLTLSGISIACAILLANLGARAWRNVDFRPISYKRPFPIFFCILVAIATGIFIPYCGFRRVQAGGRAALETIVFSAVVVAVVFAVSDFDEVQKFIVVGSENCNQDPVNIAVGIWWTLSLLFSMFLSTKITTFSLTGVLPNSTTENPFSKESLVEKNHDSPVGYKVPSIPDLILDPVVASQAVVPLPFGLGILIGIFLAFGIGGLLIYTAFTDADDEITRSG